MLSPLHVPMSDLFVLPQFTLRSSHPLTLPPSLPPSPAGPFHQDVVSLPCAQAPGLGLAHRCRRLFL